VNIALLLKSFGQITALSRTSLLPTGNPENGLSFELIAA
jgi:hypothetical protein